MAFEPYGGMVWEDESPAPVNPVQAQMFKLAALGAASSGALALASRSGTMDWNLVDVAIHGGRYVGDMSPFGLLNTFRVPDFLSPFGSPTAQELDINNLSATKSWNAEFLKTHSTQAYLSKAFGLTPDQLYNAGITPGMVGSDDELASELIFERNAKSSKGQLYTLKGGQKHVLSNDVSLMKMVRDSPDFLDKERNTGRAAFGVFQALNMWATEGFNPEAVLRLSDNTHQKLKDLDLDPSRWLPIPSVTGAVKNLDDLKRRSALLRALPAFEMERTNRLISGLVQQTFGQPGESALKAVLGIGSETLPGPASHTFMRLGGRAAALGGAYIGLQQLDWFGRNYGLGASVSSDAAISAGVGYGLSRISGSGKVGMFGAVASFFGQRVLPGFDQGTIEGVASMYTTGTIVKASTLNPANYYRRTVEGYLPGVSDWKLGVGLGLGAVALSSMRLPGVNRKLPELIMGAVGSRNLGLGSNTHMPYSARDIFWHQVQNDAEFAQSIDMTQFTDSRSIWQRAKTKISLLSDAYENRNVTGLLSKFSGMWDRAEEAYRSRTNPLDSMMLGKLDEVNTRFAENNFTNKVMKEAYGFGVQSYYSFFGATPGNEATSESIRAMGFGSIPLPEITIAGKTMPKSIPISPVGRLGKALTIGLGVFGAQQILSGGLFGSMETSQELADIYSGKQLVEVKRSRFWEGGGTPFGGSTTSYFRPHQYHLMMNRTREKGIWGEDEDSMSPIRKFFVKNFTYGLELQNYHDRPYPITSAAFSDVPVIGGILASTIGQLIKPPKLMHTNEWIREGDNGNLEYANTQKGFRREPAYDLGAKGSGPPTSPFDPSYQALFLSYQFREMEGLTGWAKNLISDFVTGEDTYGSDNPILAEAGSMSSYKRMFWETQQGGLFFSNEIVRRFLPRVRSEFERVNPIYNTMPSWLPDRFKQGDPYSSIEWGEARLPGAGYASLHPELKGINPEEYSTLHKFAILADVAPFSKEYKQIQTQVYKQRQAGLTTEQQNQYIDAIDNNVAKRYNRYSFERVDKNAIELPGSGLTQQVVFAGEKLIRKTAAPIEYLIPMGFRPTQKLLGDSRDPIEQYEFERVYGTAFAFWDKPIRDWFRPSAYSAMNLLGYQGKPLWREDADNNAEYFDKLEFYKWMKLAEEAGAKGDGRSKRKYLFEASRTRTGVNPQGNPMSIYWSIPDQDKPFFNAFANAQGRDRDRILEMVPQDQVHLYKAIWSRKDSGDERNMYAGTPAAIDTQYLTKQFYELDGYFQSNPLPSSDWIGFHEDVDLSDIRARYIEELGKDLHDYGMWDSQVKQAMRQEFLEGATDVLPSNGQFTRGTLKSTIYNMIGGNVNVHQSSFSNPYAAISYKDNREEETRAKLDGYMNGY